MEYRYKIPIKEHYQSFLIKYGIQSPYKLSLTDLFGRVLVQEMGKGLCHLHVKETVNYPLFEFVVPAYILDFKSQKFAITPKTIKAVDCYLRALFYKTMLDYYFLRQSLVKEKKKQTLRKFFNDYNLNETDLELESVYKYLLRFLRKNNTNLSVIKSVA